MAGLCFDDALKTWRDSIRPRLGELQRTLLPQLMLCLPVSDDKVPSEGELEAAARVVMHRLPETFASEFAEAALCYVEKARQIQEPPTQPRLKSEIEAFFQYSAAPVEVTFPPPTLRTATKMWAIPAAVGAFVGLLIFPPIALFCWGSRDLGYVIGGPLGAGLFSLAVAWLSEHQEVRMVVEKVAVVAGAVATIKAIWSALRGAGKNSLWRWMQISVLFLAVAFALHATRERPTRRREDAETIVSAQLKVILRWYADLILAIAWSHPDVLPPGPTPPLPHEMNSLFFALAKMRSLAEEIRPGPELLAAVREALQAMRVAGVEIVEHAAGTPFDPAMREFFDLLDDIKAGQPIRMLKSAVVKNGQALVRGHLDLFRGGD